MQMCQCADVPMCQCENEDCGCMFSKEWVDRHIVVSSYRHIVTLFLP